MMNFIITGRKVDVTPGLRERIHKRLGKLEKYFKDVEYDVYIPSEQLVFEGDTVYWLIF